MIFILNVEFWVCSIKGFEKMKVLYVDACVRKNSRTRILADYLVERLGGEVKRVELTKCNLHYADENYLAKRFDCIKKKDFDDKMFDYAKDFASADEIVMAVPYWDFSFPALFKMYIENINVSKITFDFSAKGEPVFLCRAKKLYYVTTEGGYGTDDFGFGYIEALCKKMYGIDEVVLIKADGLDIKGNDTEDILSKAKARIDDLF